MPLPSTCDFVNNFVFGDLIYGTTFDRTDYIGAAVDKLDDPGANVTIDRLTRELDVKLKKGATVLSPSEFHSLPQDAVTFLKFAQQCGPMWAKMKGDGASDYTKKYNVAKSMPALYGHGSIPSTAYMRAKCKVGIQFVLACGYTVHFALDSLWTSEKMETIARKETNQPWHTGSELRWVYRHKADSEVANRVIFYVNGKVKPAPWDQWPNAWKNYGKTRLDDEHVPEDYRK